MPASEAADGLGSEIGEDEDMSLEEARHLEADDLYPVPAIDNIDDVDVVDVVDVEGEEEWVESDVPEEPELPDSGRLESGESAEEGEAEDLVSQRDDEEDSDRAPAGTERREATRRPGTRRRRRPAKATDSQGARGNGDSGERKQPETSAAEQAQDDEERERTRGQMLVYVQDDKIQVAILEGRTLVEHYVAHRRAQSIAGNVYLGKVQNVLPGMEAAFVDIGTPKNAVLYAGDVRYAQDEFPGKQPRIEDVLEVGQSVLVQVVKDPMGSKGARLTTEISLPGRFLVLVPESESTGISRRLADRERERLRDMLKKLRPEGFGVIVRTAAEETTEAQLKTDLDRLEDLWHETYRLATRVNPPHLVYEEPDLVIRTVREIFSADFRRLIVDDTEVHARICEYLGEYEPDLVPRVQLYEDDMPLFRRYHVTEQLKQALSRKVWLPSGGSLVFDRGEALTVVDVNTSKNVGKSSLEETVYQNNLEAAEEIARQLRLRDIGGIIVIDFIDMEIKKNRDAVLKAFRRAVAQDKTKTQVYEISELGLVEMTRKNVSEGLIENFSRSCPECNGRGVIIDDDLLL